MKILKVAQTVSLSLVLLSVTYADDLATLTERLHQAESATSLDTADLKPWHLKLDANLVGEHGAAPQQGVIEEWWTSPTSFQIVYTFPSYTAVEIRNESGLHRTKTAEPPPFLLKLLLDQVIHPMPAREEVMNSRPDLRKQSFGKVPLDCIMLSQEIKGVVNPPLGLFPTYCFDPGKTSLRVIYGFGSQLLVRNSAGVFEGRNVATNITINDNGTLEANARVSTLESKTSMTIPEIDPMTLKPIVQNAIEVAPGVMGGHLLSSSRPIYPEGARNRFSAGVVLLDVVIGADGHIHFLRLASTPDPELALAAIAAVRKWTYTPYLFNGEPIDVKTRITVNFNFNIR